VVHPLNSKVCSDFGWGLQSIRLVSYHSQNAMNSENNSNKNWPDPKDYGLPVVDIKPINSVPSSSSAEVQKKASPEDVAKPEEILPNPVVQSIIADKSAELKDIKAPKHSVDKQEIPTSIPVPAKKEFKRWVGITAVFALMILAVIIWQMTAVNKEIENPVGFENGDDQIITTPEEPISSVNDSKVEEIQEPENQFAESELPSSPNTTIQKSETGTTIDLKAIGTLIRVESKTERPTYFIIVGSLPNERFALEEAPKYQNRVPAVYLITPYDDTKNYRLAIGSFGSFTKANEELERIKADYTEALWILKY
jgi:hypothetical protein